MGRKQNKFSSIASSTVAVGLGDRSPVALGLVGGYDGTVEGNISVVDGDGGVEGGKDEGVDGVEKVKRKRERTSNVQRTITQWLDIVTLWKQYCLETVRERRARYLEENPDKFEMYANTIKGVGIGSFLAAVERGYGGDSVDLSIYHELTRQAVLDHIMQDNL
jgi:hypothetical protein